MAAPAPVSPIGAAVAAPGPSTEEQFFAPVVMQPGAQMTAPSLELPVYTHSPRIAGSGGEMAKWFMLIGVVAFLFAAFAAMWYGLKPGASAASNKPVALAPKAPTAGLPTSLTDIVRIQAESSRRTAMQTIEAVGNADMAELANAQPSYEWIAGNQPSTDPHIVSVAKTAAGADLAVSGSNKDICAFARWAPDATPTYVTMANETTCSAANAPADGWSKEPGGAASDLPDDNG
jgi:hypothetical protein